MANARENQNNHVTWSRLTSVSQLRTAKICSAGKKQYNHPGILLKLN